MLFLIGTVSSELKFYSELLMIAKKIEKFSSITRDSVVMGMSLLRKFKVL